MFPVLTPTEFPPLDATIIIGALSVGLDLSALPLTAKLKPVRTHFSTAVRDHQSDLARHRRQRLDAAADRRSRASATTRPRPDVRAQFDALRRSSP